MPECVPGTRADPASVRVPDRYVSLAARTARVAFLLLSCRGGRGDRPGEGKRCLN